MTGSSLQETYMKRCLDLALSGAGQTAPNPMVGAVIVYDNTIIGEGYHQHFGHHHAEVNAVNAVKDQSLLRKSTLYVNLEPCSHKGKTPPCTDLIIQKGIPEVVIGTPDPNPLVGGNGIKALREAGVKVHIGILEKQCIELNRRFLTFYKQKRPYIILKWAQSSDGFIDVIRKRDAVNKPTWISNEISRMFVHKWRSEEQAILVGTQTAEMDNPGLNVREWPGNHPLRMVIDRNLILPEDIQLMDNSLPTVVFNQVKDLTKGNIRFVKIDFERDIITDILQFLTNEKILSLIVEGGRATLTGFIEKGLWDEARVFKGNIAFGDGVRAPVIDGYQPDTYSIREDTLLIYRKYSL